MAAIAFDAEAEVDQVSCNMTATYSHTCTGSQLILFVSVVDDTTNGADKIAGVTYAGVSMTRIISMFNNPGNEPLFLYMLTAPATGANNVVITSTANITVSSAAVSYTGAAQSGQPDATSANFTIGNSATCTTNVVAANCWVIAAGSDGAIGSPTAGTGINAVRTTMTFEAVTGDSNGTVSTGNYNTTFNRTGGAIAVVAASFAPFTAVGPTTVKTWNGITQSTGIKTYQGVALASVKSVNGVT